MKKHGSRITEYHRGTAFLLAVLFAFVTCPFSTYAVESEIGSQDAVEGQEITDCLEISALIADTWEEDYFGTIVLDTNAGEAEVDGETEDISDILDTVSEEETDGDSSTVDSEEILDEYLDTLPEDSDLYVVEETDDGEYEITAPFQTKRLIVETESLDATYGAEQIYYNTELGETILQFATVEETRDAYEELCQCYSEEDCYPDVVFVVDDIIEASSTGTGSYSWGNTYMGMDTLKTEAAGKYGTVTVAILDTGIDKSNQLFQSRKISSKSYNFIGNNKNVSDKNGHGTHVAGIIADATPSNVRLMMLKITNKDGFSSLLTIKTALQYAVKQNVCVINMSIGFISASAMNCKYLNSLINKAYRKGIPIVTAAGNSAINVSYCYPACNKKTIAVSALDNDGVIAEYSNVGSRIDFSAPGTAIVSAKAGGKLVSMSGTSMAAPHITAAIAYLKMMQPNLSVSGVYKELKLLSVDLGTAGKDNYYGWGCPNLTNLLQKGITYTTSVVTNGLTTPVIKSVKNQENGIKITWKKVAKAKKYYLYRKTGNGSYKRIQVLSATTRTYLDKSAKQGKKYTYVVKAVKGNTKSSASKAKSAVRLKTPASVRVVSKKSGRATVKWTRQVRVTSYQIRYAKTKNMKNAVTVTVSGGAGKTVVTGLKKKTYYFKVRSVKIIDGATYYSPWSEVKKVKIK